MYVCVVCVSVCVAFVMWVGSYMWCVHVVQVKRGVLICVCSMCVRYACGTCIVVCVVCILCVCFVCMCMHGVCNLYVGVVVVLCV